MTKDHHELLWADYFVALAVADASERRLRQAFAASPPASRPVDDADDLVAWCQDQRMTRLLAVGSSPTQKPTPVGGAGTLGRTAETGDPTNRRDAIKVLGAAAVSPEAWESVFHQLAPEAMEFTRRAGTTSVGPGTLEHLEIVVTDFNRAYARTAPAELFPAVRWYRQGVAELIAGPTPCGRVRHSTCMPDFCPSCWAGWPTI